MSYRQFPPAEAPWSEDELGAMQGDAGCVMRVIAAARFAVPQIKRFNAIEAVREELTKQIIVARELQTELNYSRAEVRMLQDVIQELNR